jgi:hypothetical protein
MKKIPQLMPRIMASGLSNDRNRKLSSIFIMRNGNGVTGKPSRGNELPNGFLDVSGWEWLLQEKGLQGG